MTNLLSTLRKHGGLTVAVIGLLLFFVLNLMVMQPTAQPVQAAVITPIAQTARGESRVASYFVSEAITADTRRCFDLADMDLLDLQYQADATTANTTTITFQQTNIDPTAGPFNSAQVIATVISTDANTFSQIGTFGRWNCVFADVTNSNPLTLTIIGVAK